MKKDEDTHRLERDEDWDTHGLGRTLKMGYNRPGGEKR
jgi:hypothetical protein